MKKESKLTFGLKLFVKYKLLDLALCVPLLAYAPNIPKSSLIPELTNKNLTKLDYRIESSIEKSYIVRDVTSMNEYNSNLEKKLNLIDKLRN